MEFYRKRLFPLLAGCLWAVFLAMDLARLGDSTPVKFAAICLCALTAWTGAGTADGQLVALALTLTVWADVFLLVLNRDLLDQLLGVSIFVLVQALYAFRLYRLRGKRPCRWGLALRLAVLLVAGLLLALFLTSADTCLAAYDPQKADLGLHLPAAALALLSGLSLVVCPTAVYFVNLCVNTAEAFALAPSGPSRTFAWGLLLFACCDVCVGAWNLGLLGNFARVGMWLFYLPSQVLIVLSQLTEGDSL